MASAIIMVVLVNAIVAFEVGPFITAFDTGPFIGNHAHTGTMAPVWAEGLAIGVGPSIVPRFTAELRILPVGGLPMGSMKSSFVYDSVITRYSLNATVVIPLFDSAVLHSENVAIGQTLMVLTDGQCTNTSGRGFDSFFGWVRMATMVGHDRFDGRTCDLWNLTSSYANMSLCIDGDEPLYMAAAGTMMFFSHMQRSADPNLLKTPDACMRPPKVCGNGSFITQTVYVAHPRDNYNISGQDVADLRGDAVFLCSDKMMWKLGGYELFSAFELSVVQTYGQYTNYPPPGGVGAGGDGFHVGREAPAGIGRHGGQCDDDRDWLAKLGQWLSLPPAGRCANASELLGQDCSWRIERRVKTVEMACLFDQHHFLDQCNSTHPPFDDVGEILSKALLFDDIAHGGCPKVSAPECSSHLACAHLVGDCCPQEDGTMLACCIESSGSIATLIV